YIGYCCVHRVPIENPYWMTCKELIRWDYSWEAWEAEKEKLEAYLEEWASKLSPPGQASEEVVREYHEGFARLGIHHETNAHLPMYAAGRQSDGILYSTDTCQPLVAPPSVEALGEDDGRRENVAALRACIQILESVADPHALLRRINVLVSGRGPYDLLIAANEIRHLARRRIDPRVTAEAFQSILAAL